MTTIEWTGETWNPVTGCDRTSPGCDHCYALTMAARLKAMGQPKYQNDGDPATSGPGFGVTCHEDELATPFRWRKPRTVFVNSMSDLFHPKVPVSFITDVWAVMAATPQHTYQVLTKRPQRMRAVLDSDVFHLGVEERLQWAGYEADIDWCSTRYGEVRWLPNVWLGTSIESDKYTFRADHLRATPAALRFISAEPLLSALPTLYLGGIGWLIAGAESGRGARPMDEDWVRDLRDRSVAAGTRFFYKQRLDGRGRKVSLPELDGQVWDQMPEVA